MAKDELAAVTAAVLKSAASRVPVIGEALAGVEAFRQKQREKTAKEFIENLGSRLEAMGDRFSAEWLATEDGRMFAHKVFESATDAQLADKKELFANAFVNGAGDDSDVHEKTKFVDLLRQLSRDALDVLCELHRKFGPILAKPLATRSESTNVSSETIATELSSTLHWDGYRIESAYRELSSAGLFSAVTGWVSDGKGGQRPTGTYGRGEAYTEFAERFVRFITDRAENHD